MDEAEWARLGHRLGEAVARARRSGTGERAAAVAAVTIPIDPGLDLSAAVLAARRAETTASSASSSPTATASSSPGSARRRRSRRRPGALRADGSRRRASSGRRTFADDPGRRLRAALRPPARLRRRLRVRPRRRRVARVVLARAGLARAPRGRPRAPRGEARMTVVCAGRSRTTRRRGARSNGSLERLAELRAGGMPLLDPDPVERDARRRAPRRRRTTSTPWSAPSSASRRASSRRWCSRARSAYTAPRDHDPGAGVRRAARGLPGLLLLVRGHAGARLRGRQPGAAGAPRRRARPDRGARRHDAPQRRPGRGRPPRRAAAPERQGPRGAGDRRAPHRAHARPREPVGGRGRRARAREGAQRPAPRHADPRPAGRPVPAVELAGCCSRPRRWAASRARARCR